MTAECLELQRRKRGERETPEPSRSASSSEGGSCDSLQGIQQLSAPSRNVSGSVGVVFPAFSPPALWGLLRPSHAVVRGSANGAAIKPSALAVVGIATSVRSVRKSPAVPVVPGAAVTLGGRRTQLHSRGMRSAPRVHRARRRTSRRHRQCPAWRCPWLGFAASCHLPPICWSRAEPRRGSILPDVFSPSD
ncbi:uncharacterized protein O9250_004800 [Rhynochetos jubatus]